jgi:hypothetical protein
MIRGIITVITITIIGIIIMVIMAGIITTDIPTILTEELLTEAGRLRDTVRAEVLLPAGRRCMERGVHRPGRLMYMEVRRGAVLLEVRGIFIPGRRRLREAVA